MSAITSTCLYCGVLIYPENKSLHGKNCPAASRNDVQAARELGQLPNVPTTPTNRQ